MPFYDYDILDGAGNPTGEVVADIFQHIKDAPLTQIDGRAVRRAVVRTAIQRTWHGQETKSLQLNFDPRQMASIKADVPDMDLAPDGFATFRNDAHQRKVFKQLAAAKERYQADRPHVNVHDDIHENSGAAAAVAQRFGIAQGGPSCPVTTLPPSQPRARRRTNARPSKRPTTRT